MRHHTEGARSNIVGVSSEMHADQEILVAEIGLRAISPHFLASSGSPACVQNLASILFLPTLV